MPECILPPLDASLPLLFTGIPEFSWRGNAHSSHPLCPTPVVVSWMNQTKKSFVSMFKSRRDRKHGSRSRKPIFGMSLRICQLFSLKRQRCSFSPSGSGFGGTSGEEPYPWRAHAERRTVQPGMARHGQDHRGLPQLSAVPTGASMPLRRLQRGIYRSSRVS